MEKFKDRFRKILEIRGKSQADIAKETGIDKGSISSWVNGKYEPRQKALTKLQNALGVSVEWLMGFDVPMENRSLEPKYLNLQKIPLLGEIACGAPILANQFESEYRFTDEDTHANFCIVAKGNSMIDAGIDDGDVIFCRQQSTVENGEIVAVLIDDGAEYAEATLKRVYYYPAQSRIILVAENPDVPALTFAGENLTKVRIIGKAIVVQKQIK